MRLQPYFKSKMNQSTYCDHGDGTRTQSIMTMEREPEHGIMTMGDGTRTRYLCHGEHGIVSIEMEPEHSIVTMEMKPEHELWWPKGHLLTRSPTMQRCRQRELWRSICFFFFASRKLKNKNHSRILCPIIPPHPNYPKQFVPNWHSFQIQFFFCWSIPKIGSDQGSSK